jgi:acetyl esterase
LADPCDSIGRPRLLRAENPDPDAGILLDLYNALAAKPLQRLGLQRARKSWRVVAALAGRARRVASVESLSMDGPAGPMALQLYRPTRDAGPSPAFVWFHGGGFLMGSVDTADTICRHVARASGAVVVAVPYRLVPEHDLYAGREDALAAIEWLLANASAIGIDPTRLAVGGDSAGGNLAAVVSQRFAKRLGPALRLQVLAYPATNLRDDLASKFENAKGYMLTADSIDWFKAMFSRGGADLGDPWLSPMFATDLAGLPPALVVSAGFDPIRDDGLAYAQRLREAQVPVELLHYAGQFHGFLNFDGVLHGARDALDRIGAAVRDALRSEREPAPDRTLELSTRGGWPVRSGAPGRNLLMASWMLGERLEHWRTGLLGALAPHGHPLLHPWFQPFLHPLGATRESLSACFAPLQARETYRHPAGDPQ